MKNDKLDIKPKCIVDVENCLNTEIFINKHLDIMGNSKLRTKFSYRAYCAIRVSGGDKRIGSNKFNDYTMDRILTILRPLCMRKEKKQAAIDALIDCGILVKREESGTYYFSDVNGAKVKMVGKDLTHCVNTMSEQVLRVYLYLKALKEYNLYKKYKNKPEFSLNKLAYEALGYAQPKGGNKHGYQNSRDVAKKCIEILAARGLLKYQKVQKNIPTCNVPIYYYIYDIEYNLSKEKKTAFPAETEKTECAAEHIDIIPQPAPEVKEKPKEVEKKPEVEKDVFGKETVDYRSKDERVRGMTTGEKIVIPSPYVFDDDIDDYRISCDWFNDGDEHDTVCLTQIRVQEVKDSPLYKKYIGEQEERFKTNNYGLNWYHLDKLGAAEHMEIDRGNRNNEYLTDVVLSRALAVAGKHYITPEFKRVMYNVYITRDIAIDKSKMSKIQYFAEQAKENPIKDYADYGYGDSLFLDGHVIDFSEVSDEDIDMLIAECDNVVYEKVDSGKRRDNSWEDDGFEF